MSKFLVFDTTTEHGSIALFEDKKIIFYAEFLLKKSFSEIITPFLDNIIKAEILNLKELDFVSVIIGPGSFTGTRIGLSTAKGLSVGLNIPIVPVTTFIALYEKVKDEKNVIPFVDAKKKQVFSEIKKEGKFYIYPGSYPPDFIIEKASPNSLFIGNGALLYRERIEKSGGRVYDGSLFLSKEAGKIALEFYKKGKFFKPERLKPIYLRRSDAELNRRS